MSDARDRLTAAIAEIIIAIGQVEKAFGAPTDFGACSPDGEALMRLYRARAQLEALAEEQP